METRNTEDRYPEYEGTLMPHEHNSFDITFIRCPSRITARSGAGGLVSGPLFNGRRWGMKKARRYSLLVLVQIFAGHVILRHFVGMNFFLISVVGGLHSRNYVGLERVPFFEQFVDTFGIRGFDVGQTL